MIKKKFNKKKLNIFDFRKLIFIIAIFLSIFFLFYFYFQINNKNFSNNLIINAIDNFSLKYNYNLKEVNFNQLNHIQDEEIIKFFGQYLNKSIFLVPINQIKKQLYNNSWIEKVSIKSDYKNTIELIIEETVPILIYYNNEKYFLVNDELKIIDFSNKDNFYDDLIVFKGQNSLSNSKFFLESLPISYRSIIKEAIFIGDRRWNVVLNNGIILKLSEVNIFESFKNYYEIYKNLSEDELNRINIIDLRIPSKIILQFKEIKND